MIECCSPSKTGEKKAKFRKKEKEKKNEKKFQENHIQNQKH